MTLEQNSELTNEQLLEKASKFIDVVKFSDGTQYIRMPNGNLVRATKKSSKLRKEKNK
jgi:hypothetical protein